MATTSNHVNTPAPDVNVLADFIGAIGIPSQSNSHPFFNTAEVLKPLNNLSPKGSEIGLTNLPAIPIPTPSPVPLISTDTASSYTPLKPEALQPLAGGKRSATTGCDRASDRILKGYQKHNGLDPIESNTLYCFGK